MNLAVRTPVIVGVFAFLSVALISPGRAQPPSASGAEDSSADEAAPAKLAGPARVQPAAKGEGSGVVRVFSTVRLPDPFKPWTKASPHDISGSGVILEGNRILTNAHVVQYATQVQIQATDSDTKISAKVEAIAPGIDLAVLKLSDESLFSSHKPLPRAAKLPELREAVTVYGFPTGGTTLSLTKGIVSRIEFANYTFPVAGLRIQIDAAINPGNSGGPAVVDDQMIGLAFSRLNGAQNIGYIIPCEEIDLFLNELAHGSYRGKPRMFDELQPLQNSTLRTFLKVGKAVTGMVVHDPASDDAAYPLKRWDVITHIGAAAIDDEGMIQTGSLRVKFQYLIQKQAQDGKIQLSIVRAGLPLQVTLPLNNDRPELIAGLHGTYPSYFICGPVCFSAAHTDLVAPIFRASTAANVLSAVANPLIARRADLPAFPGEQLVTCVALFPSSLIQGYNKPTLSVVKSLNGIPIRNLRHLVEVIRDSSDPFLTFEFWGKAQQSFVLPRQETLDGTNDILSDNGVRSQASPDLLAVWNAKAPAAP